jgi:hypothetical protein
MLEQKVRLISEGLARTLERRRFIKQAGALIFAGLSAFAAGHGFHTRAFAKNGSDNATTPWPPLCVPPGPYCNIDGSTSTNGCRGGSCFQHRHQGEIIQCRISYCCYQVGCWSTWQGQGYWTCCDCECGDPVKTMCGCAQYSTKAPPRPDSPVQ